MHCGFHPSSGPGGSVYSTRHLIVDADGGWERVGWTWKAHPECPHPNISSVPSLLPSDPPKAWTGRSSCPPAQPGKPAFKELRGSKHSSNYWSQLPIGRCLHSSELPRTQRGRLGGGPWAVPCLSVCQGSETRGNARAPANASPHLAGPRALVPPGSRSGITMGQSLARMICLQVGAEWVKTPPGADSAISVCAHGNVPPSAGAQPIAATAPCQEGGHLCASPDPWGHRY